MGPGQKPAILRLVEQRFVELDGQFLKQAGDNVSQRLLIRRSGASPHTNST